MTGDGSPALPAGDATAPGHVDTIAARLPPEWEGTGILQERREAIPGAPAWAAVIAEVVDGSSARYIRATGVVQGIGNPQLARNAAAGRARAVLAAWTGSERLAGTEILDIWGIPGGPTVALVRMAVPPDWVPGQPLPAGAAPPPGAAESPATP